MARQAPRRHSATAKASSAAARTVPDDREHLVATAREATRYADVDHALATVLRLISEALGWAVAEAWILRPDGTGLELAPVCYCRNKTHRPFVDVALGFTVEKGIGLPGIVWQTRQPIATHDVLEEPRFARAGLARDFGLHGAITLPIPSATEPVAILTFFDTRSRDVDLVLVDVVTQLGPDLAALVRRRHHGLDLEHRLKVTEQRYRTLFERSPAGIFVANTDGTIADGNTALAKIVGETTRDDVVGRRFSDFLVDPTEWDRLVALLSVVGPVSDVELRLHRRDGEVRWVLANAALAEESGTSRIEGQVLDLTERKRVEEAQREALRSVAALARATAHEIFNPLNPLIGQLALVARTADDPATRSKVEVAIRSAEAIRDIVRRMINITQLEFERPAETFDAMLDIRRSAPRPETR